MTGPATIEDYLAGQPEPVRGRLEQIRALVHEELPDVEERIAYGMPTFARHGRAVVHVAGWARHVSLYPMPAGDPELERDASPYLSGKGTVRLPLSEDLPVDLVRRLLRALAAHREASPETP